MFREIIRVTTEKLQIKLSKNLLNKTIEVLAFPVSDKGLGVRNKSRSKCLKMEFDFNAIQISTKGWKFDRLEIYDD